MQPPAITRRRRPFLAPFWVMWLLLLAVVAFAFIGWRSATTTTVVLVRHAERGLVTIDDPPLSTAGQQRADKLAQMFGDVRGPGRIEAIFTSDARRTQQTAMPLAARLGIKPEVVPAADVSAVVSHALHEHRGGRVLIVGHSNTLPQIVKALSGVELQPIGENEFDNVYVVTVPTFGKANVLRLKY